MHSPPNPQNDSNSDSGSSDSDEHHERSTSNTKKRHTACEECRKKKLKCCGTKPICAPCQKSGRKCVYMNGWRKSGPKPGFFKLLNKRIEKLESAFNASKNKKNSGFQNFDSNNDIYEPTLNDIPQNRKVQSHSLLPLGVDEPYPSQEVTAELLNTFFKFLHPYFGFLDRSRFSMPLFSHPPSLYPYLFYAVMAVSALINDDEEVRHCEYYKRSIKYTIRTELRGFGEEVVNIQYVQAILILNTYESLCAFFAKAWITGGKTIRAAQMVNLHGLDKFGFLNDLLEAIHPSCVKTETLYPHVNSDCEFQFNTEVPNVNEKWNRLKAYNESARVAEARRTFWLTYILDRFGSISTGWPTCTNVSDISTLLPMDDFNLLGIFGDDQASKNGFHNQTFHKESKQPQGKADNKPLYCTLKEFIRSPEKYERGPRSYLAYAVSYSYILKRIVDLRSSTKQYNNGSSAKQWWDKNEELHLAINRFAACIPSVDTESPYLRFIILIHIHHYTCRTFLSRISSARAHSLGLKHKAITYDLTGLQSAIDLTMKLRMASELYAVMCIPSSLHCIYTAAHNFLEIMKDIADEINKTKNLPASGSSAAATLAYSAAIISQCRSYLDFFLNTLDIVKGKLFMAQCFYEKLRLDIASFDCGNEVPRPLKFTAWVSQELKKQEMQEHINSSNVEVFQTDTGDPKDASFELPNITAPGTSFWRIVRQLWESREGRVYAESDSFEDDGVQEPAEQMESTQLSAMILPEKRVLDYVCDLHPVKRQKIDKNEDELAVFDTESKELSTNIKQKPTHKKSYNHIDSPSLNSFKSSLPISLPAHVANSPDLYSMKNVGSKQFDLMAQLGLNNSENPNISRFLDTRTAQNANNLQILEKYTNKDQNDVSESQIGFNPFLTESIQYKSITAEGPNNSLIIGQNSADLISLNTVEPYLERLNSKNVNTPDSNCSSFILPLSFSNDIETTNSVPTLPIQDHVNDGVDILGQSSGNTNQASDLSNDISTDNAVMINEFESMLKHTENYPDHLNWNSETYVESHKELIFDS